jgi:hypothetical protein
MKLLSGLKMCGALALFALALTACEKPGPAEEAGKNFDQAVDKAGDKIDDAADKVKDKINEK